jgi:excisionase family DNA binding protein
LEVSDQSIRRWVKAGELKAYKPKKEYRIAAGDLQEFLEGRAVPLVQTPLPELPEERRSAIDYGACRAALDSFCDHWQPALAGKRRLEHQDFQAYKADAASLSRLARELMAAEMAALGQQYDEEGEPVFYTEQSELGPGIVRFHDLTIRMGRIGKERFGEDLTSDPEMGELIELFREAS